MPIFGIPTISKTNDLAKAIAGNQPFGMEIGLIGQLGAGKTTFTRELVSELGAELEVSSPTYVLQHVYDLSGGRKVEHWDLYRLSELPEELSEPVEDSTIRVIEWADKSEELMNRMEFVLDFSEMAGIRTASLSGPRDRVESIAEAFLQF